MTKLTLCEYTQENIVKTIIPMPFEQYYHKARKGKKK